MTFFEMVRVIALRAFFARMFLLVLHAQSKNQSAESLWTVPSTCNDARLGNNDDRSVAGRGRANAATMSPMRSLGINLVLLK